MTYHKSKDFFSKSNTTNFMLVLKCRQDSSLQLKRADFSTFYFFTSDEIFSQKLPRSDMSRWQKNSFSKQTYHLKWLRNLWRMTSDRLKNTTWTLTLPIKFLLIMRFYKKIDLEDVRKCVVYNCLCIYYKPIEKFKRLKRWRLANCCSNYELFRR